MSNPRFGPINIDVKDRAEYDPSTMKMSRPMTPSEMGHKGGTNRWKGRTKAERSAHAVMMNRARWGDKMKRHQKAPAA